MEESKNESKFSIKKLYKLLIYLIGIILLVSLVHNYRLKADVHNLMQTDLKELKYVLEYGIEEIEEFEKMEEKRIYYDLAEGLYRHSDKVRHYMTKISDKLHVLYIINNNYDLYNYKWNYIAERMEDMCLFEDNFYESNSDYYVTEESFQSRNFINISTDIKKLYENLLVKVEYELENSDDYFWRKRLKDWFMEYKTEY